MPKPTMIARQTAYAGYLTAERVRVRLQDGSEADREVESHRMEMPSHISRTG
jgi:hypothetical protein